MRLFSGFLASGCRRRVLAFILLFQGVEARPERGGDAKETEGPMRKIALALVITGSIATSAWADEPAGRRLTDGALAGVSFTAPAGAAAQAPADEAEKPYTLTIGTDIPSDYYFRGLVQETEGFIFQPYVDLGLQLGESVTLNVGFWNSMHSNDATGYYEADPYVTLGLTRGAWSPSVTYTLYTGPSDVLSTIHELAFGISHDSPLAPSANLAVELNNDNHTYFDLGIEPGIPLEGSPVSLSVPVAVGLSLNDYYGETFGFFKAGLAAGVELGSGVEVHGSIDMLVLGDTLRFDDKTVKPVFSIGLSYTY